MTKTHESEKTVSLKQIEDEILRHVKKLREYELIHEYEIKTKVVGMWDLLDRLKRK